jgi:biotin synthase-related radical SAM superfamily protein
MHVAGIYTPLYYLGKSCVSCYFCTETRAGTANARAQLSRVRCSASQVGAENYW